MLVKSHVASILTVALFSRALCAVHVPHFWEDGQRTTYLPLWLETPEEVVQCNVTVLLTRHVVAAKGRHYVQENGLLNVTSPITFRRHVDLSSQTYTLSASFKFERLNPGDYDIAILIPGQPPSQFVLTPAVVEPRVSRSSWILYEWHRTSNNKMLAVYDDGGGDLNLVWKVRMWLGAPLYQSVTVLLPSIYTTVQELNQIIHNNYGMPLDSINFFSETSEMPLADPFTLPLLVDFLQSPSPSSLPPSYLPALESFFPSRTKMTLLRKSRNNYDNRLTIPRVVYQTYRTLDAIPHKVFDAFKLYGAGYEHEVFDDDRSLKFLKDHFVPEVAQKFQSFKRGAHKADLWRYCVLYLYGGVYLDIKTVLVKPLSEIFDHEKDFQLYTVYEDVLYHGVYQGILATFPFNPIIKSSIEFMLLTDDEVSDYNVFCLYLFLDLTRCMNDEIQLLDDNIHLFRHLVSGETSENCPQLDRYRLCCSIVDDNGTTLFKTRYTDFPWVYERNWNARDVVPVIELPSSEKVAVDFEASGLFDVLIPVDIPRFNEEFLLQLNFTLDNVVGYRYIYIVSPHESINVTLPARCFHIAEKSFPFQKEDLIGLRSDELHRPGWYLQQLLKLYGGFVIPGILPRYLALDADTFVLSPTTFLIDGRAQFQMCHEHVVEYFNHMNRLHPSLIRMKEVSGVCHHMLFETKFLKQLIDLVEDYHNYHRFGGKRLQFWEIFIQQVVQIGSLGGASEYEIYFHFMLKYHPNEVSLRRLPLLNTGSWMWDLLNTNNKLSLANFNFVSFHHWVKFVAVLQIVAVEHHHDLNSLSVDVQFNSFISVLENYMKQCQHFQLCVEILSLDSTTVYKTICSSLCSFIVDSKITDETDEVKLNAVGNCVAHGISVDLHDINVPDVALEIFISHNPLNYPVAVTPRITVKLQDVEDHVTA